MHVRHTYTFMTILLAMWCLYRFGQGKGYRNRIFLVYHGSHYDTIVWEPYTAAEKVQELERHHSSTTSGHIVQKHRSFQKFFSTQDTAALFWAKVRMLA